MKILLKEDKIRHKTFFAIPISKLEYKTIQEQSIKKIPIELDNERVPNVILFGDPLKGDNSIKQYIDESLIFNRYYNVANFFTSNPLKDQRDDPKYHSYGQFRYWVQGNIDPKRFLKEICRFFNQELVLVYIEDNKLTNIPYDYMKTIHLVRDGYTNSN